MAPADKAWATLGAAILVYEITAVVRGWELLSEAADRYRRRRPMATHLTVLYLAGHLLRRWPPRADPLHRLASLR